MLAIRLPPEIEKQLADLATRLVRPENEGKWRYPIGDDRVIVSFEKSVLTIYVVEIGYRREIYR